MFLRRERQGNTSPVAEFAGGATIPWRNPEVVQPAKMRDPILMIKIEAHSRVSL